MAACNNCSDESVRVLPNKDSTSVGRVPETAAKSDKKKGNICPSPVSHFNTLGDDPHTCSELLLYNSVKQVLEPTGWSGCTRAQTQAETEDQEPLSGGCLPLGARRVCLH